MQNALACAGRVLSWLKKNLRFRMLMMQSRSKRQRQCCFDNVAFFLCSWTSFDSKFKPWSKTRTACGDCWAHRFGKTTVINLLMRFYDVDSGSIKVEGIDIRNITRQSLRENYGMVLQDTWLKSGTIRENITMGKPDATEEEIHCCGKSRSCPQFYQTAGKTAMIPSSARKRKSFTGTKAIAQYCPRYALFAADAYFGWSNIFHWHRTEVKIQEALQDLCKAAQVLLLRTACPQYGKPTLFSWWKTVILSSRVPMKSCSRKRFLCQSV